VVPSPAVLNKCEAVLLVQYIATVMGLLLAFLVGFILEVMLITEGCRGVTLTGCSPSLSTRTLPTYAVIVALHWCV